MRLDRITKPSPRVIGLLAVALIILVSWLMVPREPTHQGRTASEWLNDIDLAIHSNRRHANVFRARHMAATEAFKEMGQRAVPFLCECLEVSLMEKIAIRFANRQWAREILSRRNADRPKAAVALVHTGDEAGATIPMLAAAAQSPDELFAGTAMAALALIEPGNPSGTLTILNNQAATNWHVAARSTTWLGPAGLKAVPALSVAWKTTNQQEEAFERYPEFRANSGRRQQRALETYQALHAISGLTSAHVPELLSFSESASVPVRYWSILKLTEIGVDSPLAFARMEALLEDNDTNIQAVAAVSLERFAQPARLSSVLSNYTRCLDHTSSMVRSAAVQGLGRLGTPAHISLLKDAAARDPSLERHAGSAIEQIERRRKAGGR